MRLWLGMFLLVGVMLNADSIKTLEFRNQELKDILLSFGELNRVSIVPDETVEGRASYVFANMEFDQALRVFLETYKLSFVIRSGVYYVSKITANTNQDGTINLAAFDVPLRPMIKALSTLLGKTILYDNLPTEATTINLRDASIDEILNVMVAKYPDFVVETKDKYFYLKQRSSNNRADLSEASSQSLEKNGDLYTWKVGKARFRDLLVQLFEKSNYQLVLLMERDQIVEGLSLRDLDFDSALRALLLQGNADYSANGDVFTIFEAQRRDLMKRFMTNVILPFEHVSASDFQRLIPATLGSASSFRVDEKANKLVLSGFTEEIQPVWDFFKLLDQESFRPSSYRVDLQYIKAEEFIGLIGAEYATFSPMALPAKNGILIAVPESKRKDLEELRKLVDRPLDSVPVKLHFLKADDLLTKLPPSVTETNLVRTNDPALIFFKGSPEQLKSFQQDLTSIDQPRPLLRYEILVLQFDEGKGLNLNTNYSIQSGGSKNGFAGDMGKLLGFSFDVVGNFGIGFGMNLSAALAENNAKVVADSTLNGLAGEKISFQNTNTTRYTDYQVDPSTGKNTATGTVKELSSGLILTLEGWISADHMITLKVDATLSKQTPTASTTTASLPSTSEKKISTLVRTPSGKPLVIGGLKQEDVSFIVSKTPFLGDIPLLGLLFQKRDETITRTEFSLYIVPILDRPEWKSLPEDEKALSLYRRFHPDQP